MNTHHAPGCSQEIATVFKVDESPTVGVLHDAGGLGKTGMVFVVGGRQYRTGAQRQFVRLARHVAENGFPAFRFDVRGMGDNTDEPRYFLDTRQDICAAVAEFQRLAPQLERIVLWGLCDGASASIAYASAQGGIDSVIMVNPWITTTSGAAGAAFKYHYQKRLMSLAFWRKLISGDVNVVQAVFDLLMTCKQKFGNRDESGTSDVNNVQCPALPDIVFDAIREFNGDVFTIISQKDLTALEFKDEHDRRVSRSGYSAPGMTTSIVDADHTFSKPEYHTHLEALTLDWCRHRT